jgi:hypothetical protein
MPYLFFVPSIVGSENTNKKNHNKNKEKKKKDKESRHLPPHHDNVINDPRFSHVHTEA